VAHLGSTYRLQVHGVGLRAATTLVPYLADLGIETLYLAPLLVAMPGSTHGYDVVDTTRLDPALGTDEDLEELLATLLAHDMRALVDIVPNHMATDRTNAWWWDLLQRGASSPEAAVFDIDWSRHGGRVLVPHLGRPLGDILADEEVELDLPARAIRLGGTWFPLCDDVLPPADASSCSVPALLASQHYRPASWRLAATEGNYRRFFDIATLIGVRVDDAEVYARTHQFVLTLCRHPAVAGVRVDHVDGLADPTRYLERLRRDLDRDGRPAALVVEKILAADESLDDRWPVDGTTGYEFADRVLALLVDPEGADRLHEAGATLVRPTDPTFASVALRAKREVLEASFAGELDRLTRLSMGALGEQFPGHDLARRDVRGAWVELTVHLDVYRTYLDGAGPPTASDRARILRAGEGPGDGRDRATASHEVRRATTLLVTGLLHHVRAGGPWLPVAQRWQQLSGAVMAKGVEDTATYRYVGPTARADVGGDPDDRGAADAFHEFAARGTAGLNATSTHDSKRNEDARCRLAALSQAAGTWVSLVEGWHRRCDTAVSGRTLDALAELRAYETLFTLWPPGDEGPGPAVLERATRYAVKAAREAKQRTSWSDPDESYEECLTSFLHSLVRDAAFRDEMTTFTKGIAPTVLCNVLATVVLKICCPGVPDFYQGTEFFEPVLTDPDNRRPVDFAARVDALATLPDRPDPSDSHLLAPARWGLLKMYVTTTLLRERRRTPRLFEHGAYRGLDVTTEHAVALARLDGGEHLLAVVPRLSRTLVPSGGLPVGSTAWGEHALALPSRGPGGCERFEDLLTGRTLTAEAGRLPLRDVLAVLPVAVLRSGGSDAYGEIA
jgi:(1->4)-alpha-D-glucan 1-alpha-D-glucosylmutase